MEKSPLTPIGRITVIKSLILPLFTHCFYAIPTPNKEILKIINKLMFGYLWDGKPYKIKSSTLVQKYENGGLNMVDIIICLF